MLVTSKQMVLAARQNGYAVGCFNTSDLEITKAIIAAATAQNSPVIIATSEKAIEYAGLETLAALIKEEALQAKIPVALHLDHGQSITTVEKCLRAGYTSVMFDGSSLPLEENEVKTRHAVELAHHQGVPCEGELGHLGKVEENTIDYTDPDDVPGYLERTGVDFLAVSVGSKHGSEGEGTENLKISLLNKISQKTDKPLVLHGASGVAESDIRAAIQYGIAKVNIDTDIRLTFSKSIRKVVSQNPHENDPREILIPVMGEVQRLVEEKIKLFGSDGKVSK